MYLHVFYCLTAYESGFYYCTSTPIKQYFCNHSLHKILEWITSGLDGLWYNIWQYLCNLWSKPNQRLAVVDSKSYLHYNTSHTLWNIFSHNYIAELISLAWRASHLTSFDTDGWIYIPTPRKTHTCCYQCNELMMIVHVTLAFLSLGRTFWNYLIRIWLDVRRNEVQPILWLSSSSFTSSLTNKHICQPPSSLAGDFRL